MSPTGIIDVIPNERWAPIGQNAHETSSSEMTLDLVKKQVCHSETIQRRRENAIPLIERERAFDAHFKPLVVRVLRAPPARYRLLHNALNSLALKEVFRSAKMAFGFRWTVAISYYQLAEPVLL